MEDHRLKAFCLVAELKSFSRAARAKHMTQSAMSHLIKNLEHELGFKLLHRNGKVVTPTPSGNLFYEHAKKILEDFARMDQDLSASGRGIRGPLCIGSSRTPAGHLLSQVLYNFSKAHRDIQIDLVVSNTDSIIHDLRDGRIDIGIVEGTVGDHMLLVEHLAEDEVVIIAPEDHPLAKKKAIAARDLEAQVYIFPESGSRTRELVDNFLDEAEIDTKRIKIKMTIGNPDIIVQMVQAGIGLGFASKWSVFTAVKDGTVKLLNLPNKKMKRNLYLITNKREPLTASARAFKEFIKQYRFFAPF